MHSVGGGETAHQKASVHSFMAEPMSFTTVHIPRPGESRARPLCVAPALLVPYLILLTCFHLKHFLAASYFAAGHWISIDPLRYLGITLYHFIPCSTEHF
jgi:hypothetical protein